MHKQFFSLKTISHIQIFFIFILPIVLLYFEIIPKAYRIFVLIFMSLCIYGAMWHEKWSKQVIGIARGTYKKYFLPYIIFSITGCVLLILYAKTLGNNPNPNWWKLPHFWFLFLLVSFFQEFAYRSFLSVLLSRLSSSVYVQVFFNALLFTFLHIIYPNKLTMLPLAFVGGLFFSYIYSKYPNLILISISHSILNFTAVLYGFFVLAT